MHQILDSAIGNDNLSFLAKLHEGIEGCIQGLPRLHPHAKQRHQHRLNDMINVDMSPMGA